MTARLAAEQEVASVREEVLSVREKLEVAEAAAQRGAEQAERSAERAQHLSQQLAQTQAAREEALAAQAELQAGLKEARGQIGRPLSGQTRQRRSWMLPRLPCMMPWLPRATSRCMTANHCDSRNYRRHMRHVSPDIKFMS